MRIRLMGLILILTLIPVNNAHATETQVTVMSRNLYLGADVGVAMKLLPKFSEAAQFMWDQVKATNFKARAPKLVQEVATYKPDVIGLQEATIWYCKKNLWSKKVEVFNFTKEFLSQTRANGEEYVLAEKDGVIARNPGYSIAAIPYLTMVKDPATFQPLFGSDKAACGFEIGDALAVKKSLADKVQRVGNSEYEQTYTIIPTLMTIYRGYTWADISINGVTTRFVTTHLESIWDKNKIPNSTIQATQLVRDLSTTKIPLIVIGDFNADPRDPRGAADPNPGEQPVASDSCPAQTFRPVIESADATCNAYWVMKRNGFFDASPDPQNPVNYSWGSSELLAGPDDNRYQAGLAMGNTGGFTDRLDYVFVKNGVTTISSRIIGNQWPVGLSTWQCNSPEQRENTRKLAGIQRIDIPQVGFCYATDHAGVVSTMGVSNVGSSSDFNVPPAHQPFPISFWQWVGIGTLLIIVWRIRRRVTRTRDDDEGNDEESLAV